MAKTKESGDCAATLASSACIGRGDEASEFFRKVARPDPLRSMCLYGIPRSGRTRFLQYVADPLVAQPYLKGCDKATLVAYVNLSGPGVEDPAGFYAQVARQISGAWAAYAKVVGNDQGPSPHAAVWRKCGPTAPEGEPRDSSGFETWLEQACEGARLVILLDEFESIVSRPTLDDGFFRSLRALANVGLQARSVGGIAWVTATHRRLFTLFERRGWSLDAFSGRYISPFGSDILVEMLLGSLSDEGAQQLVEAVATRADAVLDPADVPAIRELGGGLPFYLERAAETWLACRRDGLGGHECSTEALTRLMGPYSAIPRLWRAHWDEFTRVEQDCLQAAAAGDDLADDVIASELTKNGLLVERNGLRAPNGALIGSLIKSVPHTKKPRVFIGHGGHSDWLALKGHLQDLEVEPITFESEAVSPNEIARVLDERLNQATFALLVFTKEDRVCGATDEQPTYRARQNVVHELGLFQAKLGSARAVIVAEDKVELPSNVGGFVPLHYRSNHIEDAFPKIDMILKREGVIGG